jgi:hypothetical protein
MFRNKDDLWSFGVTGVECRGCVDGDVGQETDGNRLEASGSDFWLKDDRDRYAFGARHSTCDWRWFRQRRMRRPRLGWGCLKEYSVLVWPRMGLKVRVPGCWSYFPAVRTDCTETN